MTAGYLVRIIRGKRNDLDRCRRIMREGRLDEAKPRQEALSLFLGFTARSDSTRVNHVSVYHTPSPEPRELGHALGVFAFVIGQSEVEEPLTDRVPGRVYATLLIEVARLRQLNIAVNETPLDCTTFYPTVDHGNHRDLLHDPTNKAVELDLLKHLICRVDEQTALIELPLRLRESGSSLQEQVERVVTHCRREFGLEYSAEQAPLVYDGARWQDCTDLPAPTQVKRTLHLARELEYAWGEDSAG